MSGFTNLGDLVRRDRDLSKIAVVDLGGEESPREFTYAQLDAMANGVARALTSRGHERGDRIAILSANRAEYLAAYYGILRAGLVAVPVNFKFPRATIHFILQDSGAKLVFCDAVRLADCPDGLPVVLFGGQRPSPGRGEVSVATADSSTTFSIPARSKPSSRPGRTGDVSLHLGLDRHAEGRRAFAPEPHLGGRDAAGARDRSPPLSDRGAALSHECARAFPTRLRRPRHHRAAAAIHRPRLYRGDRALPRDVAHRRAADDRHDAAGEGVARRAPISRAWSSSAWARRR